MHCLDRFSGMFWHVQLVVAKLFAFVRVLTEVSYSDQAKHIFDSRKQHNINTKFGEWLETLFCYALYNTEQPFATNYSPKISHRVVSTNTLTIAVETLVWLLMAVMTLFCLYLGKMASTICISSCFMASHLTNHIHGAQSSGFKTIRNRPTMFFAILCPNTLATCALHRNSLWHTRNGCTILTRTNCCSCTINYYSCVLLFLSIIKLIVQQLIVNQIVLFQLSVCIILSII